MPGRKTAAAAAAAAAVVVAAASALLLAQMHSGGGGAARQPSPLLGPVKPLIEGARQSITVESPAFSNGSLIPRRYTCDGVDVSPPLEWGNTPPGTRSILVLVYDPDAPSGFFIHWLLYRIPPVVHRLPEALPPEPRTPYGLQAVNDFHRVGYGGPCPPPGETHRYVFLVAALDTVPEAPPGAPAREVLAEARGHVLAYGYLVALYRRGTG